MSDETRSEGASAAPAPRPAEASAAAPSAAARLGAALGALHARVPFGMRLDLAPMREACARAGHPERAFEVVHVAGTNGKGSTCAMLEAIARASGRRTGLYTSPHLVRFAERIRVDGAPLDDAPLADALEGALAFGPALSFFEVATLAALLAFQRAGVELAVLEVGLGGRLDATNVVPPPRCAAVTRVALDHQEVLGDTLGAVAREKAAIAKAGAPIVIGAMPEEAIAAVRAVAVASGARVLPLQELPRGTSVAMAGAHQRDNARVAWTVAAELGIDLVARARGLGEARWPGRLERVDVPEGALAGPWILDGAHNPDGVAALVAALTAAAEPEGSAAGARAAEASARMGAPGAVVFGALADKPWKPMLEALRAVEAPRFYVRPAGRAPADPRALAEVAPGEATGDLDAALAGARAAAGAAPVVVCGSLYLVGEARARLLGLRPDPIVAL